jgi:protein SYS1
MNTASISSMNSNNATTMNNNNGGLSAQNNINRRPNNSCNGIGNNSSNSNDKSKKKKFYPKLIATQIVAIQCFHYFILTLLYEMNAMIFAIDISHISFVVKTSSSPLSSSLSPIATTYMSLDRIFTDQYIHLYHLSSYPDIITVFIAAICTAYVFVVIVEKSKQCLDFAITLFLCHLLLVWMYNQKFPTHIEWYIVHVIATITMILLAEHLCAKRELDDIPLLTL